MAASRLNAPLIEIIEARHSRYPVPINACFVQETASRERYSSPSGLHCCILCQFSASCQTGALHFSGLARIAD